MNTVVANSIYLNEDTGGKGRFFKSRFLQAGLVKYQFGVCLLKKETIDKFVNTFIGCPVVINHQDVTDESAKEQRVGVISRVYFEPSDAWFWCEGVLFDNEAIDLVQKGFDKNIMELSEIFKVDKKELISDSVGRYNNCGCFNPALIYL